MTIIIKHLNELTLRSLCYKFILDLLQFPKYIVGPISYSRDIKKFILSVYRLEHFSLK